ncbi:spore germination protein [Catenibacillus scindens]|uniref:Spore germination protein n=1 Tax=Catenibacillus scindens TaxID=673271 RepID=A0A7W8HB00_9FIRM|nr:glycosyl hydrolase family 18 protein [Catenibacillus scindens]MBB5265039.1 spore germination protein [Catenibacillus scindens]
MTIHIVRQGDDLESIARTHRIPLWLLLMLNGLSGDETLVPGQSLLILYPQIIHHVRAGDTLYKIARQHHISLRTLYQNNPGLILKPYIYPGDPVVIAYKDAPTDTITVNGYAYPFIPIPLFTETLPYLTGFNSFTYELTNDGRLALPPADEMLIDMASLAGVLSYMVISNLREPDGFDPQIAHDILSHPRLWPGLAGEILSEVQKKGYAGVDVDFEYVMPKDRKAFPEFLAFLRSYLAPLKKSLSVALAAKNRADALESTVAGLDYQSIAQSVDYVLLMTYEWGYARGEPRAVAPLDEVEKVLDFAVTQIPSPKILLGIPNYGYDWPLPYIPGTTRATSISNVEAVNLARTYHSTIKFDETAQAPWLTYTSQGTDHIVWFEDVRSIRAKLSLIHRYRLKGACYWNLMRPFPPNWPLVSALYKIRPDNSSSQGL